MASNPSPFDAAHDLLNSLLRVHPFTRLIITDDSLEILDALLDINRSIAALDHRLAAMDCNWISHLINSRITDAGAPIAPLHAIATNLPIENFPQTSIDIAVLDEAGLDSLLLQLEQPMYGNVVAKRHRMVTLVGAVNVIFPETFYSVPGFI
ncbi:hypothetical protein F4680DRAFT_448671 [Xylaria scruposa]|nr:hypothetical protein F4680DRAFT_448671 [Xylaria scruposa]